MLSFRRRAATDLLLGLAVGATTAFLTRTILALYPSLWPSILHQMNSSKWRAVWGAPHWYVTPGLAILAVLALSLQKFTSLIRRIFNSYRNGIITGIFAAWFALSFMFLAGIVRWTLENSLALLTVGFAYIGLAWKVGGRQAFSAQAGSINVPPPSPPPDDFLDSDELRFDIPIRNWDQDRLNRGPFIQSVALSITEDHAPAVAITGPFGEGKTSALGLLATSLESRNDLVVVNFSSWLPGDEQTLALTLFGTIAEQVKARFFIPGFGKELNKFARLLAGAVPKVGQIIGGFFDEPSQVEQLRSLRQLLSGLPIRVVVLVDEVDRMDPVELHLLLKAVRGVVDLPNLSYVCAFNKEAVVKLLSPTDLQSGQAYLEKFFPAQFSLPRADREVLNVLFDQQINSLCNKFNLLPDPAERQAFSQNLAPLWHRFIKRWITNFRRLSLFINSLSTSLVSVSQEVDPLDMLV